MAHPELPYYGETGCTGTTAKGNSCTNKAYYRDLCCGVHTKNKVSLPKNPHRAADREKAIRDHYQTVYSAAESNVAAGRVGDLLLSKMRMMRQPELRPGYLNIYPNYLDGSRKDGEGMVSLSPKSMGPIHHGQPGLPPALNLENLHQGNKCFPSETVDGDKNENRPSDLFFSRQVEMYSDPHPWRHKMQRYSDIKAPIGNRNVPLFSVWRESDGRIRQLTYQESRQVYCHFYTKQILEDHKCEQDYNRLVSLLESGYNLQICGYDAYDMTGIEIEDAYLDTSRPFGHELVLYSLLKGQYPWTSGILQLS